MKGVGFVSYNAMYAADGVRIREISEMLKGNVVGVQGAKQRRDIYEPPYRRRVTGHHVVVDFPHVSVGRKRGGPPAGVAIMLPGSMGCFIRSIVFPKVGRLQGRAGAGSP